MELAPILQAQHLQTSLTFADITDYAADAARWHHDHTGIPLQFTEMRRDSTWRYNGEAGHLSRHALGHLCSRLALPEGGTVPASYLAQCPPHLAADHINHWLAFRAGQLPEVMVRASETSRGPAVRAILSRRYAPVNHTQVLESLTPFLSRHHLSVNSFALDDELMTLRLTVGTDHPASLDDPLRVGLHVSNSEIGLGYVTVRAFITRLVCANGMVVTVKDLGGIRRRHIGAAGRSLNSQLLSGIGDVLAGAQEACSRFVALRQRPAPQPIEPFIEETARRLELPERTGELARSYLYGETLYDVLNAFTRAAQEFPVSERVLIESSMSTFLTA